MEVKRINCTDYANIYGVFDGEKKVGTVELKIAGWESGKVFCNAWAIGYTKRDIRKAWTAYRKNQ